MPESLLSVEQVSCVRDGRTLFAQLSFGLEAGQICVLLGPNGSGKSTLLRSIAGLFTEFDGTVTRAGAQYAGHRLALNSLLTVRDNLHWYAALIGHTLGPTDVDGWLEQVGMAGYGPMPVAQLSAGQARRVALVRLLIGTEPVWLLDEPYTALDTAGQQWLDGLMQQHCARGGGVVCATHQPLGIDVQHTLTLRAH